MVNSRLGKNIIYITLCTQKSGSLAANLSANISALAYMGQSARPAITNFAIASHFLALAS